MNSVTMDEELGLWDAVVAALTYNLPTLCALGAEESPSEASPLIGRSDNQMPRF
jgi:hypothetical protein